MLRPDLRLSPAVGLSAALCMLLMGCSQDVPESGNAPTSYCVECKVDLVPVGRFDDGNDPGSLPDRMVYAVQRSDGMIFTPSRDATSVLAFLPSGRLQKRMGRSGAAPGEFGRIRRVMLGPGDSLYVTDWALGRMSVFGPDLELKRILPLDYLPSVILPDGRMVVSEQIMQPDLIGYPIHVLDPSGRLERSFGTDRPEYAYDAKLATSRLVGSVSDGTIWSVAPGRYVLEHWDAMTGTRLDSFEIVSEEVTPLRRWPDDEGQRPPGIIESISASADGVIFLILRVADADWQPPPGANAERSITADEYDATYDWVVQVVDPGTRRVVASTRVPTALWSRPAAGVSVRVDRAGANGTSFTLLKPTLVEVEASK